MIERSRTPARLLLATLLVATTGGACTRGSRQTRSATPPAPSAPAAASDRGSPADVRTTSTVIDGVDVVTGCRDAGTLGAIAHGSIQPPAIVGDGAAFNQWANDLQARIQAALADVAVGVGWGLGCREGDVGPRVYVARYRDIDAAVVRLAAFARREDLALPYLVLVASQIELL